MKIIMIITALLILFLVAACARAPYEQKIEGIVLSDNKGVADVRIRFLSSAAEDNCEAKGAEAITNSKGKFEITQTYTPSSTENYAVVIHPYRLCVFSDGKWQQAWKLTTGPAPHSVAFKCYLDSTEKKVENCLVSWDKQEYR